MQIPKLKLLPLFALMLVMGAFLFAGTAAYAADEAPAAELATEAENLSVEDVWLTGDILHIIVTDKNTGVNQALEMNLRDYAGAGDEYVTVQAIDRAGNISNSIQFKNPFYAPQESETTAPPDSEGQPSAPDDPAQLSNGRPFTPDGTGTVVDNATEVDGKEFFTVETPDGNVFYLIVDRQRDADNVYLLNAVTENDLASLAKEGDGINKGAAPLPPTQTPPPPEQTPPTEPTPPEPVKSGGNTGMIIFIVIAVIGVGGAGYYFKIVRPKQNGGNAYDDEPEDFDDDTETDLEDDGEDGEDE